MYLTCIYLYLDGSELPPMGPVAIPVNPMQSLALLQTENCFSSPSGVSSKRQRHSVSPATGWTWGPSRHLGHVRGTSCSAPAWGTPDGASLEYQPVEGSEGGLPSQVRSLFAVKCMLQLKHMIAVLFAKADINRRKKNKAQKALEKRRKEKILMFAGWGGETEMQPWETEGTLVQ